MGDKRKIICTAEYGTSTAGEFCVTCHNKTYSNFKKVDHYPAVANDIFLKIHRSGNPLFADCFPPVITETSFVCIHRVNGITLDSWITKNSNWMYTGVAGKPTQLTDKLKLVIQDLGFIALHSLNCGLKMSLTMNEILVTNQCEPPRVLAVAESSMSSEDYIEDTLKRLKTLLEQIWTKCGIIKDQSEADVITSSLNEKKSMRDIDQFLKSATFWTKEVRIYIVIKLGGFVAGRKESVGRVLKQPQHVLQFRNLLSQDSKMSNFVLQVPTNNFDTQNRRYSAVEVDCCIQFLSNTLADFDVMCKVQTGFMNRVKLIEHYDCNYPEMMNELYEASRKLSNF